MNNGIPSPIESSPIEEKWIEAHGVRETILIEEIPDIATKS